ncbi:MAG: hypothetical protein KDH94_00175 [Coxiellaceae bacterium]|nr:hypothetical protein [Coxiellaceae bacterium]
MSIRIKAIIASSVAAGLILSSTAFADTCPTDLKKDDDGYWYSDTKPGWKSHKTTPDGVTVSSSNFGGVVYSPSRNRMACVYKASDGKWVALVSNVHHGIVIDKKATDDSGNGPAWQFSTKHKDYACGHPTVTNIQGCQFQLSD